MKTIDDVIPVRPEPIQFTDAAREKLDIPLMQPVQHVAPLRRAPKVAIIGGSYGREQAPFRDEDYEIWCLNDIDYEHCRIDRWFQFHDNRDMLRRIWMFSFQRHLSWLQQPHPFPIYMQRVHDDVPSSVRFPKEEIEAMVPHGRYFASSFSWMIALAIHMGFQHIGLYGCGGFDGEPVSARACMEYWCGVAEGRGLTVSVHGQGDLFKVFQMIRSEIQYGYDLYHNVCEPGDLKHYLPRENGEPGPVKR